MPHENAGAGARVIQAGQGIQVEIKGAQSDKEMLDALERAVQDLRAKGARPVAGQEREKTLPATKQAVLPALPRQPPASRKYATPAPLGSLAIVDPPVEDTTVGNAPFHPVATSPVATSPVAAPAAGDPPRPNSPGKNSQLAELAAGGSPVGKQRVGAQPVSAEPVSAQPSVGQPAAPEAVNPLNVENAATVVYDDSPVRRWLLFPKTLLWEPPLANPLQPRMYVMPNSLRNANTLNTVDTAIGGTVGLIRNGTDDVTRQGFQIDFFAVVLSRWADFRESVGVDYRVGLPLTFAWGNWQAKIAYEHTSTHLGDQFVEQAHRFNVGHVRDETVFGLSHLCWDQVRVYGIFGYAFNTSSLVGSRRTRFDWGVEWSKQQSTGWAGQPFAAFDMELRSDQDYTANTTTQVGWQWKELDSRASLRVAAQYYTGSSPYGQFFRDRESWWGLGVFVDF
jgi:hypothetical protein